MVGKSVSQSVHIKVMVDHSASQSVHIKVMVDHSVSQYIMTIYQVGADMGIYKSRLFFTIIHIFNVVTCFFLF